MTTVVHVGYHKTATTMLQQVYFPALADCVVVGPNNPGWEEFSPLVDSLCFTEDDDYSDAAMRSFLDRIRGNAGTLVVSHENISHHRAGGRTAERLHSLFPDARALVCVRDQRTMLAARYGQYVKKGGSHSFARYVTNFDSEFLHYDLTVDDLQRRFGADRVKVLPFELLVRDQRGFFAELDDFVGGQGAGSRKSFDVPRVNRTLAPPMRAIVRVCNRLSIESNENPRPPLRLGVAPRVVHKLQKLDPVWFPKMSRRLGRRDRARVEQMAPQYADSNARLEQLTGLQLRDYGYVVAGGRD